MYTNHFDSETYRYILTVSHLNILFIYLVINPALAVLFSFLNTIKLP